MEDLPTKLANLNRSFISKLLKKYNVPGVAIGVFDKNIKLYYSVGKRNYDLPVTENTAFRVASLTKPVFAYLCLQLYLNGDLDLDTPLIQYYGEKYIDDKFIEELTARHILSHQSGFPN